MINQREKRSISSLMVLVFLINFIGGCGLFDNNGSDSGAFSSDPLTKEEYRSAFEAGWNAAVKFLGESVAEAEQSDYIQSIEEEVELLTNGFAESIASDTVEQEKDIVSGRWSDEFLVEGTIDSEEAGLNYYSASDEMASEQAISILDTYIAYEEICKEEGGTPIPFQEYVETNGYGSDVSELASVYIGDKRIIPQDRLDDAVSYVLGDQESFEISGESAEWNDALSDIRNRVCNPTIVDQNTISDEEVQLATELASTGLFNPEKYGIKLTKAITPKYIIKQALLSEPQEDMMDVILKIGPDLFSITRELVKTGEIDIEQLTALGIDGLVQSAGAIIEGATACLIHTACKNGKFGPALKNLTKKDVATFVKITMQSIRYGYALYNGEITVEEYGDLVAESIIQYCQLAGGVAFRELLDGIPYAYEIGSMVGGMIAEVGINILKYAYDRIILKKQGAGGFEVILPVHKVIDNLKELPVDEWIDNLNIINRLSSAEDLTVSLWDDGNICIGYDGEYFCPVCEAVFNEQEGFNPNVGYWYCTNCGQATYDSDNVYNGEKYIDVMWFCDECGDFLNKQEGFTDTCGIWKCLNCGYENTISEEEIRE